ncbi:Uncharacterised protein [Segatella copri]|nr:Uncharacterised protein [Segatella copri]
MKAGRLAQHGEQVAVGANACQALFAFIDERNLFIAA